MPILQKILKILLPSVTVIKRFWLPLLFSTIGTSILVFFILSEPDLEKENTYYQLARFMFYCDLAVLASTAAIITSEVIKSKLWKKYSLIGFVLMGLIVTVFYVLPDKPGEFYVANYYKTIFLILILILSLFLLPFLRVKSSYAFWKFTEWVLLRAGTVFFFVTVLFIGISAAFSSIDFLLGVNVDGKVYAILAVLIYNLVFPFYILQGVPNVASLAVSELKELPVKVYKFFAMFILIPLVSVYTLILYAYGVRVLVNNNWPENMTVYLILAFIFPGFLAVILLFPWQVLEKMNWVKNYFRVFAFSTFPLMILYYSALYIRIKEFGLTIDRLYVIVFGVWVMFVMLYLFIYRTVSWRLITSLLMLLIILVTYIPFINVFSIAEKQQSHRLETILNRNKLLVNGKIEKLPEGVTPNVDSKDQAAISEILDYLGDNHGYNSLRKYYSNDQWKQFNLNNKGYYKKDYFSRSYPSSDFMKSMGLKYTKYIPESYNPDLTYTDISVEEPSFLNTTGYTKMLRFSVYDGGYISEAKENGIQISISSDKDELVIKYLDTESNIQLKETLNDALNKADIEELKGFSYRIKYEDVSFPVKTDAYEGQIVISQASVRIDEDKKVQEISSLQGYFLVK